jgi:hypothetical protein
MAMTVDRKQILGIWKLISWEVEFQDTGKREPMFGAHPGGFLIFTPEGRMMALLEGEGRQAPQDDAGFARAFQSMLAYSGTYIVEGDRWSTQVDAAWHPAWKGTEQTRSFKIEGDRLSVVGPYQPNPGGRSCRGVLSFERSK